MRPIQTSFALLLAALLLSASPLQAAQNNDGIDIKINIDGDQVHLDVDVLVDAKPSEVWAVMTDFDHMAEFISNLKSSQVISRNSPTSLTVEQHGRAGFGPVSFSLDSIRDIQMQPYEWIKSQLLSGSMKKFVGETHLGEDGEKTRVQYHSDAISSVWIPPVIGRNLLESETREQFGEIVREILRRKHQAADH